MEAFMEAFSGLVALVVVVFLIALAVLSFLLPFFVFRIRNEMIAMNKKMSELVRIVGGESEVKESEGREEKFAKGEMVAICPHCDTKNSPDELNCLKCGKPLF